MYFLAIKSNVSGFSYCMKPYVWDIAYIILIPTITRSNLIQLAFLVRVSLLIILCLTSYNDIYSQLPLNLIEKRVNNRAWFLFLFFYIKTAITRSISDKSHSRIIARKSNKKRNSFGVARAFFSNNSTLELSKSYEMHLHFPYPTIHNFRVFI